MEGDEKRFNKPTQAVLRIAKTTYLILSIELVQAMIQRVLSCISILKKNKNDIPTAFLPTSFRNKPLRLYKRHYYGFVHHKSQLLLSFCHHHTSTDPLTNKPDDFANCNCTKRDVDSLDEKCSKFSCSRQTQRWPVYFTNPTEISSRTFTVYRVGITAYGASRQKKIYVFR